MKEIARYTGIVLITILILILLWQVRQAILLFLFSLAVAAAFRPLVDYLAGKKISRIFALLISYTLVIAVGVGLLLITIGPLPRDIKEASNHFISEYELMMTIWPKSNNLFLRNLATTLPPAEQLFAGLTGQGGVGMIQTLFGVTTSAITIAGNLGIILVLSIYWSVDDLHFERLLLYLIPVEKRDQTRLIWQGIEKGIGAYIRSELSQSLLAGLLLWVGYRLMGLDYPVLLAFLGGLLWLIPWFGAILAVIPPFLVGINSSISLGLLVAFYTLAILVVQEYVIEPRIFRRRSYSSVVLVFVALALGDILGLLGLLLAPLASTALQIVFKYTVPSPIQVATTRLSSSETTENIDVLHMRLANTLNEMNDRKNTTSPEISNLMKRLDKLIDEAQQYLN